MGIIIQDRSLIPLLALGEYSGRLAGLARASRTSLESERDLADRSRSARDQSDDLLTRVHADQLARFGGRLGAGAGGGRRGSVRSGPDGAASSDGERLSRDDRDRERRIERARGDAARKLGFQSGLPIDEAVASYRALAQAIDQERSAGIDARDSETRARAVDSADARAELGARVDLAGQEEATRRTLIGADQRDAASRRAIGARASSDAARQELELRKQAAREEQDRQRLELQRERLELDRVKHADTMKQKALEMRSGGFLFGRGAPKTQGERDALHIASVAVPGNLRGLLAPLIDEPPLDEKTGGPGAWTSPQTAAAAHVIAALTALPAITSEDGTPAFTAGELRERYRQLVASGVPEPMLQSFRAQLERREREEDQVVIAADAEAQQEIAAQTAVLASAGGALEDEDRLAVVADVIERKAAELGMSPEEYVAAVERARAGGAGWAGTSSTGRSELDPEED